jgi:uncharacterized protein
VIGPRLPFALGVRHTNRHVNDTLAEPIGPVPGDERITVIDCLRGAALFGILMANMRGFHSPMDAYMDLSYWSWLPDRVVQAIVDWFISGKFITIFAALFGVGFAIQMERAAARNRGVQFYARRMAILFLIGLVHGLLIWWGDILTNYAICGIFLLYFRSVNQRALLVWAHWLYWMIMFMFIGFALSTHFGTTMTPEQPEKTFAEITRIYAHGSVRELFALRAREWAESNAFFPFLTRILGTFLFGVYIWRQGYLRNPELHLEWWRKAQRIGLIVGVVGNAVSIYLEWRFNATPEVPSLPALVWVVIQSAAIPALSLGYAATIVVLWQDPVWRQRLMPFSYVGRMALTNYLLQSIICTTIFYSYGFGLYGRSGPLIDVPVAIVIYGLQVPFSRWWLSGHRYGPVEWVWRRLTYGSLTRSNAVAA